MISNTRQWLKKHLPQPLLRAMRSARLQWQMVRDPEYRRISQLRKHRKEAFRLLNRDCPPGRLRIRPGVEFGTTPEAAASFAGFGYSDERSFDELDQFLSLAKGRSVFLDIGSFYGVYSTSFCATTGGKAFAFEPSPLAFPTLQQQAALNPTLSLTPLQMALGESAGEITMSYEWKHLVVNPIGHSPTAAAGANTVRVPISSLDLFCSERDLKPDLIKIDVEGHEYAVLCGATRVLRDLHPPLLIELHFSHMESAGFPPNKISELLVSLGYSIFDLNGAQLKRFGEGANGIKPSDVICLHSADLAMIERIFSSRRKGASA